MAKMFCAVTLLLACVGLISGHGDSFGYKFVTKHDGHHNGGWEGNLGGQSGWNGIDNGYGHHHQDYHHKPNYKFEYGVKDPHTGDHKSQWESRHGDVVKGGYKLKEADGTTRLVHYTADKHNGFNAHVEKIGHAHHPAEHTSHHGGDWNSYGSQNNGGYGNWNNGGDHYQHHHGATSYSYVNQHH